MTTAKPKIDPPAKTDNYPVKTINWIMFIWVAIAAIAYLFYYGLIAKILLAGAALLLVFAIFKLYRSRHSSSRPGGGFGRRHREFTPIMLWLFGLAGLILTAQSFIAVELFGLGSLSELLRSLLGYEYHALGRIAAAYLFCSLFLLVVYVIGKTIINAVKIQLSSPLDIFLAAVGSGLIPIMLLVFLIALLKLLYPLTIWILILLLLALSRRELKSTLTALVRYRRAVDLSAVPPARAILYFLLALVLAFQFIAIIKPIPVNSDDLNIYYNVPQLFAQYHRYEAIGHYTGANMGQNAEMLYAATISALGTVFIIHYSWLFFLLFAICFYRILELQFDRRYAALGLAAVFTIPWNFDFINSNKVEMLLLFYIALLFLLLSHWLRTGTDNRYLYLLGVFAGIAMGIKYTAGMVIAPLYLFLAFIIWRRKRYRLFYSLVLSGLLLGLFFAPWAIKNLRYFGNPVYPFFNSVFHTANSQNSGQNIYLKNRYAEIYTLRHDQIDSFAPFRLAEFVWNQSVGRLVGQGPVTDYGFIPLLVIPFYFLYIKKRKIAAILYFALSSYALWLVLAGSIPSYAIISIVLLYALLPLLLIENKLLLYTYLPLAGLICIASFPVSPHNIDYLVGKDSAEQFYYNYIPYYRTAEYINALDLDQSQKIMLLGDSRVVLIDRNDQLLIDDVYLGYSGYNLSLGDKHFEDYLRQKSIRYLLVSQNLNNHYLWLRNRHVSLDDYLGHKNFTTDSIYQDIDKIAAFADRHARLVYEDGYYYLYELDI